jgi:hypothetical protein
MKMLKSSVVVCKFIALSRLPIETDRGFDIRIGEILGRDSSVHSLQRGQFFATFKKVSRIEVLIGHVHHVSRK